MIWLLSLFFWIGECGAFHLSGQGRVLGFYRTNNMDGSRQILGESMLHNYKYFCSYSQFSPIIHNDQNNKPGNRVCHREHRLNLLVPTLNQIRLRRNSKGIQLSKTSRLEPNKMGERLSETVQQKLFEIIVWVSVLILEVFDAFLRLANVFLKTISCAVGWLRRKQRWLLQRFRSSPSAEHC